MMEPSSCTSACLPPNWRHTVTPLDHRAPADPGISKPCNLQCALRGMFNLLAAEKPEAVILVVEVCVIPFFYLSLRIIYFDCLLCTSTMLTLSVCDVEARSPWDKQILVNQPVGSVHEHELG